jgi:hypothetical protein
LLKPKDSETLGGLGYFSGLDTSGTNFGPFGAALGQLHANGLQVWIKTPRRSIVCVGNIVSKLRTFAADFATFSHDF